MLPVGANSDRRLQRITRFADSIYFYMNTRPRIISPSVISQLETLSFVLRDAISLIGRELVRGLLAEDNMWRCAGVAFQFSLHLSYSHGMEPRFVLKGRFKPTLP